MKYAYGACLIATAVMAGCVQHAQRRPADASAPAVAQSTAIPLPEEAGRRVRAPRAEHAPVYYSIAVWALLEGRLAVAERALVLAKEDAPGSRFLQRKLVEFYVLMAQSNVRSGDLPAVLRYLERAAASDPDNRSVQLLLAHHYMNIGEYEQAEDKYEEIVEKHPEWPRGYLGLVAAYHQTGKSHLIESMLLRLYDASDNPRIKAEALHRIGREKLRAFHMHPSETLAREAMEYFRKMATIAPDYPELHKRYAEACLVIGRPEEAVDEYLRHLDDHPADAQAHLQLYAVLESLGRVQEAAGICEEYLERFPETQEVLKLRLALARLYERSDRIDRSIATYKSIIASLDDKAEKITIYQMLLLPVYERHQRNEEAAALLEEAIAGDLPNEPDLLISLALIYQKLKKPDQAIGMMKKAIQDGLDSRKMRMALGQICGSTQAREHEGLDILTRVQRELEGMDARGEQEKAMLRNIHFVKSMIYDQIGNRAQAARELLVILDVDPEDPAANNNLAYLYAEQGINLEEAETRVKHALKYEPDKGVYLDSLGWVQFRKGDLKGAVRNLEKAAGMAQDPVIHDHLGEVYYALKRYKDAARQWRRSLELNPDDKAIRKKLDLIGDDSE